MNTTWYEKGLEKGRREILHDLLEEKFGPLASQVQERLQQLAADRLVGVTKAVLRAQSLRELGLED